VQIICAKFNLATDRSELQLRKSYKIMLRSPTKGGPTWWLW